METVPEPAAATPSAWLVRAEDVALALWVAFAAPALYRLQGSAGGPFDPGRPVDGMVGLAGIAGAVVCLAARPAAEPTPQVSAGRARAYGLGSSAALGPFAGGLLAVGAGAGTGLELGALAAEVLAVAFVAMAVVARLWLPPLSARARRALVTPYVVAAGGLFASFVDAVTAGDVPGRLRAAAGVDLGAVLPVAGFLLAFSAVFYAMLVYAPRQVAEREGTPVAWLVRYAAFVLSVALGAGWISLVAG